MHVTLLEDRLDLLTKQYEETQNQKIFEDIEQSFRDYLRENPQDSEIWIRLALFLNISIVSYSDKSIEILEQLLLHDNKNIKALLILADIQDFSAGGISNGVSQRLFTFETDNNENKSMIEYAKARYCFYRNKERYEEHLVRSTMLCSRHVNNNKELGKICIEKGRIREGCALIKQALKNIKCVCPEVFSYIGLIFDIPTADEYLGEFIKGTMTTKSDVDDLGAFYHRYCIISSEVPKY